MKIKRIVSMIIAVCLVLTSFVTAFAADTTLAETGAGTELASTGSNIYGLADNVQDGQILQCWNWSYQNIAANMAQIAQQGFSAIQTSPIQATKETTREYYNTVQNSSWVVYQPVAFNIETNSFNALGVKSDFEYMCQEAHKYGVKVIVDAVLNHMANDMSENTIHPWIPSEIRNNSDCWHDISMNIYNYENRYDVTHYCLSGLPDLNSANSTVQTHCINFLKEAIAAGADGFRFDAAKHIETDWDSSGTKSDFWKNVLGEVTSYAQETRGITPYYYGEILGSPGGGLSMDAYTQYMSVTDTGANDIRYAVCSGNAAGAANPGISCGAAPSKAVQWNESHDTYKDNGTKDISSQDINKTWAIVGSRNEVCGMYLARPSDINTTMMGDADQTSWASRAVKAVNKFKNHFRGEEEYMSSYNSLACVERGDSGMVIVNTGGTYYNGMSAPVHIMASGTYTDAITGNTFTVSDGYISGDIGDTGIAVVYDVENSGVFSTGNVTELSVAGTFNNWDLGANVMMANGGNTATTTMYLDAGTYEFKVVTASGTWYGNSGTIEDSTTSSSSSGWTMSASVTDKCTLVATGGKYTFTFDVSTNKLIVEHESTNDRASSFYLKGTFNNWDTSNQMSYTGSDNIVSTSVTLDAGTYTFKLNNEDTGIWYSNTGTISDVTNSSGWTFKTGLSDKCTLVATGGTYTFSFNLSTQKLVVTSDSVTATTVAETTVEDTTVAETTVADTDVAYYLKGTFNNWEATDLFTETDSSNILTLTKEITAGTYTFKLYEDSTSTWYGNTGTINDTTGGTGWTFKTSVSDKCTLVATGGTYTFNLDTSTNKLTVAYTPAETDPSEVTYTVTFKDYDGTVLSEQTVKTGTAATAPADPVREKDAQYTYTFSGWDTAFDNITADTTVTATYSKTVNTYKVTFKDYDGTVLSEQTVDYGASATAPASPAREGYTFTGWDTAFDNITADTTVTATYSDNTVYLKGTFNNWSEDNAMTATEGSTIVTTTLELEEGTYTFKLFNNDIWYSNSGTINDTTTATSSKGWSFKSTVSDKCTLVATGGTYTFNLDTSTYRLTVLHESKEYTVDFCDYDGSVISTQTVKKGSAATAPADPVREKDAQYTYTFSGWDTDFSSITADTTVTATYTKTENSYTVIFKDYDGTVLDEQTVKYGASATAPENPVRDGYTFKSWDSAFDSITADTTVTATYTKNAVAASTGKLKIDITGGTRFTISINGGAARPQGLSYTNTKAPIGATVTIVSYASTGADFLGWVNEAGAVVSTSETYTFSTTGSDYFKAMYITSVEGVNLVTFKNAKAAGGNGQIIDMQYYAAGDEIVIPDGPTQAGYIFTGWDMTAEEIAAAIANGEDVTVQASWEVKKVYVAVNVTNGAVTANGGEENGKYLANRAVTVTADAAPSGQKFAYWTNENGSIKSFDAEYKFYPAVDTTLIAVYVAEDEEIVYQALADIAADPSVDGEKISYTLSWNVPSSVGTYKSSGLMVVNKADFNADTFYHGTTDTKVFDRALSGTALKPQNTYSISKGSSYYDNTYVAATWVQYEVNGERVTIYSDFIEVTKLG